MKKNIYISITESFCCTVEINITLQINSTSKKLIKKNRSRGDSEVKLSNMVFKIPVNAMFKKIDDKMNFIN